jgi:hypothetical protein
VHAERAGIKRDAAAAAAASEQTQATKQLLMDTAGLLTEKIEAAQAATAAALVRTLSRKAYNASGLPDVV